MSDEPKTPDRAGAEASGTADRPAGRAPGSNGASAAGSWTGRDQGAGTSEPAEATGNGVPPDGTRQARSEGVPAGGAQPGDALPEGARPASAAPASSATAGASAGAPGSGGAGSNGGGPDRAGSDGAGPGSAGPDGAESDGAAGQDGGAGGAAATGTRPARRRRRRSFWRELPVLIVVALAIALLIKTFVVQAFYIPTGSMENTLIPGDKVLVNKVVYHLRKIEPGDIVVFSGLGSWNEPPPPSPPSSDPIVRAYDATLRPLFRSIAGLFGTVPGQTDYIKRVIGVPGDRVACCNAQGLVTVNGVPLHEASYLFPGTAPSRIRFHITVPPGRLWVMGDNRGISDDSRLHRSDPGSGTVPEDKVVGRAFLIVWPPGRWRVLPVPSTFSQPGIHSAASSASARAAAVVTAGAPVAPSAPLLPLAAGFGLALPVTWLQRRARPLVRRRVTALAGRVRRLR